MYLPFVGLEVSGLVLVLLGFAVGVLGGFFGIGGAFMVTPALNILGFPMSYAIGTDLAHVMGKSIVATSGHLRLGNVDMKLGAAMILGTALGVEAGKDVVLYLERVGFVEALVRWTYVLLLTSVSAYMILDYLRSQASGPEKRASGEWMGTGLSRKIRSMRVPPMVSLPRSGIDAISIWVILLVGFSTGFLAGFLGVGGGFIRVPALIYALGVPTTVAIGTDLFEIIFSAGIGAFLYALEGRVEIVAAAVMLSGAAVGAQLGAIATRHVEPVKIRLYFAATVASAAISVLLKQISDIYGLSQLGECSTCLILGASAAMSLIVILSLFRNAVLKDRWIWHR